MRHSKIKRHPPEEEKDLSGETAFTPSYQWTSVEGFESRITSVTLQIYLPHTHTKKLHRWCSFSRKMPENSRVSSTRQSPPQHPTSSSTINNSCPVSILFPFTSPLAALPQTGLFCSKSWTYISNLECISNSKGFLKTVIGIPLPKATKQS